LLVLFPGNIVNNSKSFCENTQRLSRMQCKTFLVSPHEEMCQAKCWLGVNAQ
jgi:hypothetical protein